MSARVLVERDGAVAEVKLNRPDKRNGLDLEMFEQLSAAGREVGADKTVRAVILSGAGKGFCAGLDWMSFMTLPDQGKGLLERPPDEVANLAQQVAWVWQQAPMPVIAAIHGFAMGGGLQIALGADLVYAEESAQLSVMEGRYGIIPDMGITQTLLRRVSIDVAKELVFTARRFSAKEGVELGLISRVVDDPLGAARLTAKQIAKRNPHAVRAAKQLINEAWLMGPKESFALETQLQLPLLGSKNQLEAAQAVFQKRDPVFDDPE
ncbi:MAG: crotonase/enoyl-CoA hydratase family protein [Deltaproteobacteria bacterium]|jgi:enoyl-CoA hydratase/carnithine racemase|nr:crotonase/enoyl-CoA hydratase family protein [Deltaproteobacteria bacterium]MBW2531204.1 crotonase/enoyl-CoA hydratase family protein [Deltaproteobacteria bacterium]